MKNNYGVSSWHTIRAYVSHIMADSLQLADQCYKFPEQLNVLLVYIMHYALSEVRPSKMISNNQHNVRHYDKSCILLAIRCRLYGVFSN